MLIVQFPHINYKIHIIKNLLNSNNTVGTNISLDWFKFRILNQSIKFGRNLKEKLLFRRPKYRHYPTVLLL